MSVEGLDTQEILQRDDIKAFLPLVQTFLWRDPIKVITYHMMHYMIPFTFLKKMLKISGLEKKTKNLIKQVMAKT